MKNLEKDRVIRLDAYFQQKKLDALGKWKNAAGPLMKCIQYTKIKYPSPVLMIFGIIELIRRLSYEQNLF